MASKSFASSAHACSVAESIAIDEVDVRLHRDDLKGEDACVEGGCFAGS